MSRSRRKRKRRKHKISTKYQQYLLSDWWKTRKKKKIVSVGCKCELCSVSDIPLHVHHLTYARVGAELDEDLQVLCEPCHKAQHPGWK